MVTKTEEEWRRLLTPEQFRVARKKGTEIPFTGAYWNHHEKGIYQCACCGSDLFSSETKFESGTGWPSFSVPINQNSIKTELDSSLFMDRTGLVQYVQRALGPRLRGWPQTEWAPLLYQLCFPKILQVRVKDCTSVR